MECINNDILRLFCTSSTGATITSQFRSCALMCNMAGYTYISFQQLAFWWSYISWKDQQLCMSRKSQAMPCTHTLGASYKKTAIQCGYHVATCGPYPLQWDRHHLPTTHMYIPNRHIHVRIHSSAQHSASPHLATLGVVWYGLRLKTLRHSMQLVVCYW